MSPNGSTCLFWLAYALFLWRATIGRIPLGEWSARRRDLYLTTQHSQQTKRQTSMLRVGFEPTISAGKRPKTYGGRTSCLYLQGDNMCEICSLSDWPQYLRRISHLNIFSHREDWGRGLFRNVVTYSSYAVRARKTMVWNISAYDCPEKMRQLLWHTCLADGPK